ncbi:DUF5681 domain-containing protein [uncultured Bradyrhizobium sp.]|jgi:hypothetical protein|uniref:DUF5681 domain-containing protein n=1 Tax=uncultured Bradyrhizobium sp. TaxID=199684 RepID=UPI00260AD273|nr:DUF5681 domain-containing protein [uncultured Bradyrhizobium sp.]
MPDKLPDEQRWDHDVDCGSEVGYRKPPKSTRFVKGQSGNPAGRPRKQRASLAPYAAVLERKVTIREGGRERQVTAAQAFLLQLLKRGLEGGGLAARTALDLIQQAKTKRKFDAPLQITLLAVAPGSVSHAIERLGMATKIDPYSESARMELEPWIVEAALSRLPQPLTVEQQRLVIATARLPKKVKWPEWWSERP